MQRTKTIAPRTANRGWHSRGYLPHLEADQIVQFVTFRLADSLPARVIAQVCDEPGAYDAVLDNHHGACWLRHPNIASMVEIALLHFDDVRYRLLAWCMMPNHVHVVLEINAQNRLQDIVQNWKSYTAKAANRLLGRSGPFWHPDYFDRYMRDGRHLEVTIGYVESNPVKAGLVDQVEQWRWSSAWHRAQSAG